MIRGYEANKEKFQPIEIQIDNTFYVIPFERFFKRFSDQDLVLTINTKKNIVFGI